MTSHSMAAAWPVSSCFLAHLFIIFGFGCHFIFYIFTSSVTPSLYLYPFLRNQKNMVGKDETEFLSVTCERQVASCLHRVSPARQRARANQRQPSQLDHVTEVDVTALGWPLMAFLFIHSSSTQVSNEFSVDQVRIARDKILTKSSAFHTAIPLHWRRDGRETNSRNFIWVLDHKYHVV